MQTVVGESNGKIVTKYVVIFVGNPSPSITWNFHLRKSVQQCSCLISFKYFPRTHYWRRPLFVFVFFCGKSESFFHRNFLRSLSVLRTEDIKVSCVEGEKRWERLLPTRASLLVRVCVCGCGGKRKVSIVQYDSLAWKRFPCFSETEK